MSISDLFKEPRGLFINVLTMIPIVFPQINPRFNLALCFYALSTLIFRSVVQRDQGVMNCDYLLGGNIINQPPATGAPPTNWNLNWLVLFIHVMNECPYHSDIFATRAGAFGRWAHSSVMH